MSVDTLWSFKDHRGILTPVHFNKCPFIPKRLFFITNVPKGCYRGGHAHKANYQYLICVQGFITVVLYDGKESKSYHIGPSEAVLVPPMIWDSQKFNTDNDVLMVLASAEYDETDYIREMGDYLRLTGQRA